MALLLRKKHFSRHLYIIPSKKVYLPSLLQVHNYYFVPVPESHMALPLKTSPFVVSLQIS